MELRIETEDPLHVLSSTKPVVENAQFVFVHREQLEDLAEKIQERHKQGLETPEVGFGTTGSFENDLQLVFVEDAVNFCFWPSGGEEKWQVALPDGSATEGGWYGLKACFDRGLAEGVPILDAHFLSSMTIEDARSFFRGATGVDIPLLNERLLNLQEAGNVLMERYDGKFIHLLEAAKYDAVETVKLLVEHFFSFRDISRLGNKEVVFLKRAQICPNDINYVLKANGKVMSGLENLTAFADYKLPQLLRMYGALGYSEDLARRIDQYIEIPHDSGEEIEIRAATVWVVELLRQMLYPMTAGEIDNTIWLMSQGIQSEAKPYHRTRTIYY